MLGRLAIFVGLFTLEAAQAVARDHQIDVTEVADAIASLVSKSLISVISIDGAAHYRLLDPTLTYAAQKLAQMPEENTVARQQRYYAESLSNRAGNGVAITPEDVAFAAPYLGNIRAALESSFPWLARQQSA